MLGGLALFLYGMQVMGDGLAKISEESWRKFWNLTSSKLRAGFWSGVIIAVIQSSSATTVMVVGFVNPVLWSWHRLLHIMGANIGTTVNCLIFKSCRYWEQQFLMSLLGLFLCSDPGADRNCASDVHKELPQKDIGAILLDLQCWDVWYGYHERWASEASSADVPSLPIFWHFLQLIAGVLAGNGSPATGPVPICIRGYSSGSVCVTGAVLYSAVFPIIMRDRISVPAWQRVSSAIGANKNAKRSHDPSVFQHYRYQVVFLRYSIFWMQLFSSRLWTLWQHRQQSQWPTVCLMLQQPTVFRSPPPSEVCMYDDPWFFWGCWGGKGRSGILILNSFPETCICSRAGKNRSKTYGRDSGRRWRPFLRCRWLQEKSSEDAKDGKQGRQVRGMNWGTYLFSWTIRIFSGDRQSHVGDASLHRWFRAAFWPCSKH